MSPINGFSPRSLRRYIFAFIDGLLILIAILAGEYLRFGWGREILRVDYLAGKIMLIVAVIQVTFYYFDLYEPKSFRQRIGMGVLLLKALATSCIILGLASYSMPFLALGRGVLTITVSALFLLVLSWRVIFPWIISNKIFKERLLIIGTGVLSRKIQEEILENGQDTFEIVGYIDESRQRKNSEHDGYREFQRDLFPLQKSPN
jgi:FlaA1/EpsC-like NDP-sugar epimerase